LGLGWQGGGTGRGGWRLEWAELCGRGLWWQPFRAGPDDVADAGGDEEPAAAMTVQGGVTRIRYVTDGGAERCVRSWLGGGRRAPPVDRRRWRAADGGPVLAPGCAR
jgi:hypothetical protein